MPRPLRLPILLLVVLLAFPAAAAASTTQTMTFEAPRDLLDPARQARTLQEISDFGVTRVRALIYWRDFAPHARSKRKPAFDAADPNAYPAGAWFRLDGLFGAAAARGISVQLTLTGPVPRWATRRKRNQVTDPSPKEFQAFATAVGRRYGDRVGVGSIWNEPNHPDFLGPQFVKGHATSPALYRKLYLAGQRGLRASGNGKDALLFGETAPRGTPREVAPLAFLRGALCLDRHYHRRGHCARVETAGYAHHAYTTRVGPRFRPPDADDVTIGVLSRLTRALDRAARAGRTRPGLGIYLPEFGIQSSPAPLAVSLARQSEYLGIAEHIAYVNPRVKSFSQYLLRDDKPRKGPRIERYGGFESGLRMSNGRKKPAYDAFRLPLAVEAYGSSDVLWGRVRPDAAKTKVTILAAPRKGQKFPGLRTLNTNARGVFGRRARHRRGQRYGVRWTAPDGHVWLGPPIRAS